MPTLSFIWEGSLTTVLANTTTVDGPYDGPVSPVFPCPFCASSFGDQADLRRHIDAIHPAAVPRLVIGGLEMLSQKTIYASISADDVHVLDCTSAEISIDNGPFESMEIGAVPSQLAGMMQGRVQLHLYNRFALNSQPIRSVFDLRFRVISRAAFDKADTLFTLHLGKANPGTSDVDRFCRAVGDGPVQDYADCLADYVLVVLERDSEAAADAVGKRLFSTLARLQGFPSPVATLVSSLMKFISNDFSSVPSSKASALLHGAYAMFSRMEEGQPECWNPPEPEKSVDPEHRSLCPIDSSTDAVLRRYEQLGRLPRWTSLIEESVRTDVDNPRLPSLDRAKLNAIWAANALRLGSPQSALGPLRALEGNDCFGRWASLWIERLEA